MNPLREQFRRGVRAMMESAQMLFIRDGATIYVRSAGSGQTYAVSPFACTCPDHTYRRLRCKHMLALKLSGIRVETVHGA